jgi:upstream activation factor subunit UAF30
MKTVDLETMSTKQFISALSAEFGGVDLSSKKKFIKDSITQIIDSMDQKESEEEEEEQDDASEDEEELQARPTRKKGGGGGGGLQAVKEISDELAAFLKSEKHMARTEVVKGLWAYIKEHNLQNPQDKREILLDAPMKSLFGVDRFDMFQMSKYVSPHIHPFPPLDLTPSKRKTDGDEKRPAKRKKKDGAKKQAGTQAPYRLSDELAAVCGKDVLPRPQVTQALWAYIRSHNLQNPEDKREIFCDEPLRRVMGGEDKVTMFSMNKYITPHMLEKLDKSAYVHEDLNAAEAESGEDDE